MAEDNIQFAMLYWDKVVLQPLMPHHPTSLGAIAEFLSAFDAAEVVELKYPLRVSQDVNASIAAEYRNRRGEIWSSFVTAYGQTLASKTEPMQNEPDRSTFEISLKSKLPVPDASTPLSDILDFKDKRRSEYQTLHYYIDDLASKYRNNPDEVEPVKRAVSRLTTALSDSEKAFAERWPVRIRRALRSGFFHHGVVPAVSNLVFGLEIDRAFAAGAVTGTISNCFDTLKGNVPESSFAYAFEAKKTLQRHPRRMAFRQ